jgi:hypothetical protein
MIEYIKIGYEYDPVQSIYHKSRYQDDIALTSEFPSPIRIEKRQVLNINCDLVLTHLSGFKWPLITGLTPVTSSHGYYLGNRVLSGPGNSKKTAMLVLHNDAMKGKLNIYYFPEFDTRTMEQRYISVKQFIAYISKSIGQM